MSELNDIGKEQNDDEQMCALSQRVKKLESHMVLLQGFICLIAGLLLINYNVGESAVKNFLSGLILGIGCIMILTGVYITISMLASHK